MKKSGGLFVLPQKVFEEFGASRMLMTKDHILAEIRRTAASNNGKPLGSKRFETETGIRKGDWFPHFWSRWTDATKEAGLEPNQLSVAHKDDFLIEKLVEITRQLQRVPIEAELLRAGMNDPSFPSGKAFRRLGYYAERVKRVIAYCESHSEYDDVATLWKNVAVVEQPNNIEDSSLDLLSVGYVYLLKHGSRREYKIGRTNNPIRREGELGIQLPEKLSPVHYIKTDDPAGVENYWHTRFASKRKEGEWFTLCAEDVRAFKRWKRIY